MKNINTVRELIVALLSVNPDANVHFILDGDLIPLGTVRAEEDDDTCVFIYPEQRQPTLKTYVVGLLEIQTSRRKGHMEAFASSPEEALRMVREDGADDDKSNWEDWETVRTEIVTTTVTEV